MRQNGMRGILALGLLVCGCGGLNPYVKQLNTLDQLYAAGQISQPDYLAQRQAVTQAQQLDDQARQARGAVLGQALSQALQNIGAAAAAQQQQVNAYNRQANCYNQQLNPPTSTIYTNSGQRAGTIRQNRPQIMMPCE